jgi:CHAT domain-containing protein/tetratricopeptide (TPR) repeat protein
MADAAGVGEAFDSIPSPGMPLHGPVNPAGFGTRQVLEPDSLWNRPSCGITARQAVKCQPDIRRGDGDDRRDAQAGGERAMRARSFGAILLVAAGMLSLAATALRGDPAEPREQSLGAKTKPTRLGSEKDAVPWNELEEIPASRGLLLVDDASVRPRRRIAICIGINGYKAECGVLPLHFAGNDAIGLSEALLTHCDFESVLLMTDAPVRRDLREQFKGRLETIEDVGEHSLRDNLRKTLAQASRPDDILVVFFAGHANSDGDQALLFPVDYCESDKLPRALLLTELFGQLLRGAVRAQNRLLVFDACRASPTDRNGRPLSPTFKQHFAQLEQRAVVVSACNADQFSYERPELEHGAFTFHFLQGLGGAAYRSGEERLRVNDVFSHVEDRFRERNWDTRQKPQIFLVCGDFALAYRNIPKPKPFDRVEWQKFEADREQALDLYCQNHLDDSASMLNYCLRAAQSLPEDDASKRLVANLQARRAVVLFRLGKLDEAEEVARLAGKVDATLPALHELKGYRLLDRETFGEAAESLRQAVAAYGDPAQMSPHLYAALAKAMQKQSDFVAADGWFRASLSRCDEILKPGKATAQKEPSPDATLRLRGQRSEWQLGHAQCLYELGKYEECREKLLQAFQERPRTDPDLVDELALRILELFAEVELSTGHYETAGAGFRAAIHLRSGLSPERKVIHKMDELVASAVSAPDKGLRALSRGDEQNRLAIGRSLIQLAESHLRAANFAETDQVLLLAERSLRGGDLSPSASELRVALLTCRGRSAAAQGKIQDSVADLQEAYRLVGETAGGSQRAILQAATALNLGRVLAVAGDYRAAKQRLEESLALRTRERGEWHPETASSQSSLASLYRILGDYNAAEDKLRMSVEISLRSLGPDHPETASSLSNLAMVYEVQGNYASARPLFERALAIRERVFGPNNPETAAALDHLAGFYMSQWNYGAAEPLFLRSLRIREELLGVDNPDTADSVNNLASLYLAQGKYAAGEPLLQRALKIREQALGLDHPDTASSIYSLARLYLAQKNYSAAAADFQRALKIWEGTFGPEHPQTANGLDGLADMHMATADYAAAGLLFRRALEVRQKTLGLSHPSTAASFNNLAMLEFRSGRVEAARALSARGIEIRFDHLEDTAAVQTDQEQMVMARGVVRQTDGWLTITANDGLPATEAWRYALVLKRLATGRQLRLRRALEDGIEGAIYTELRRVRGRLGRILSSDHASARLRELDELQQEQERLEKELATRSDSFLREQRRKRVIPQDVQAALHRVAGHVGLVDFLEYSYLGTKDEPSESRIAAFIARGDRDVVRVEIGPAEPIAELIEGWQSSFGRSEESREAAMALRRRLWEPLVEHLEGCETVLISPDGQVGRLPWGALPGTTPGTYLLEERAFAEIPVPQLLPELLERKGREGSPQSLLLVGDIDYDADSGIPQDLLTARDAVGAVKFVQFSGAKQEMVGIEDTYREKVRSGTLVRLSGQSATEAAFREAARKHQWLHLVTHAFYDIPKPGPSEVHPGLLSGVVFAGANRPAEAGKDDGILTALEIGALDLSGVETVVLSTSDPGPGVKRAFQVAGAKTLVASLWNVDDRATTLLMQRFYQNLWDKKMGRLAALREAQIWMLREFKARGLVIAGDENEPAPPYYWAAFVLSGDWR